MAKQASPLDLLVDRFRELDEEAKAEIINIVEFLRQKKARQQKGLVKYLNERALPSVTLEEVRADLVTIGGSMTEVVTRIRQERETMNAKRRPF